MTTPTLPEAKSVTIQDVAAAAGISTATVSRALNGKARVSQQTRATVQQLAHELGFRPDPGAQQLSRGRAHDTVGLFALTLDLGVGTEKIRTIQGLLSERGYDVPLYTYGHFGCWESHEQCEMLGLLRRQKPRAVVCHTAGLESVALEELLRYQDEGGVLVCYNYGEARELPCDQVTFDEDETMYRAARHLLDLGHSRIGLFMAGFNRPFGAQLRGFERALCESGYAVRRDWLFNGNQFVSSEQNGVLAAQQFLALRERPEALCLLNDAAAVAFIATVRGAGMEVPRDLSIVGYDDRPLAAFCWPPLTTVTHPVKAIAETVVELLLDRLENRYSGAPRQRNFVGDLVVRQSAIARSN